MRAGTLSDPRVVAALKKYFVPVHVPMLCTAELIRLQDDAALLRKLNDNRGAQGRFWGGVREVFLTPEAEVLTIFATLYPRRSWEDGLLVRRNRDKPTVAVDTWFLHAAAALKRVRGKLPDDWTALRHGTAPEVAAVRKAAIPAGHSGLRVMTRHDRLMYEGLVGERTIALEPADARALLPAELKPGARHAWPKEQLLRLGHASSPKGNVLTRLEDTSISGSIETQVARVEGATVHGTFSGRLELKPQKQAERGRRGGSLEFVRCTIEGDFVFDRVLQTFTKLRLVGTGEVSYQAHRFVGAGRPLDPKKKVHAREHRNVSPHLYGIQPYLLGVELRRNSHAPVVDPAPARAPGARGRDR